MRILGTLTSTTFTELKDCNLNGYIKRRRPTALWLWFPLVVVASWIMYSFSWKPPSLYWMMRWMSAFMVTATTTFWMYVWVNQNMAFKNYMASRLKPLSRKREKARRLMKNSGERVSFCLSHKGLRKIMTRLWGQTWNGTTAPLLLVYDIR